MGAERTIARALEIQIEQNDLFQQIPAARRSVAFYQKLLVEGEGDPSFNANYIKRVLEEANKELQRLEAKFTTNQGKLRQLHKTLRLVMV